MRLRLGAIDEVKVDCTGQNQERNENWPENAVAARIQQNERVEVKQPECEATQEYQHEREKGERVD